MPVNTGSKMNMLPIRTYREVGEILGCSAGSVCTTELRALAKMAKALGEFEDWSEDGAPNARKRRRRVRN